MKPDVEVKQVAIPQGDETYILCRTAGRKEKEKAIRHRFSAHMEDALQRLGKTIESGRLKDRNKMERRLGRIQASHSQVNDLYEVALQDTPNGISLHWAIKEERRTWRDLREGAYMLRTNLQAGSVEELWSEYMQLTEAGRLPHAEKRALHPPLIPSTRAAGQSPCPGSLSRLRPVGHAQAPAETPGGDPPATLDERSLTMRSRCRR